MGNDEELDIFEKLGIFSDVLQVMNYVENIQQAKELKRIYNFIDELHDDVEIIKTNQKEILNKLNFLLDKK